jgi:hypothetical protein
MVPVAFGEAFTAEDQAYRGSRFHDVREALFSNRYQHVWGGPDQPPLPMYEVTLHSVLQGALRLGIGSFFQQASERAVDSGADLRWGVDRRGFRRLVHPNGICLTGRWEITEQTPYSGYFAQGSRALLVGRYSTCCAETRRGHVRSLSLVGKLFPTVDPEHAEPLQTANFFTQQDIGGEVTDYVNDAELRNAPNTTVLRRGAGFGTLLVSGLVFARVDKEPTIRQLYQIAELGKPPTVPTRAPTFMRLLMSETQQRIEGASLDFRDEIMAQIFDRGDPIPKRTLTFHLEVTENGATFGTKLRERRKFSNWRRIGRLIFDDAAASYNGDCVIHFNHPTWRDNRNDPSTATRANGRKVR